MKGGFVKGWVLANVPSFRFSFRGNMRMHPCSGFRSRGTCERTLVPVFVPGEHPPKPPFWKPPFFLVPPIFALKSKQYCWNMFWSYFEGGDSFSCYRDVFFGGIEIVWSSFWCRDLFDLQWTGHRMLRPKKHTWVDHRKKTISMPNNRVQNLNTRKMILLPKTGNWEISTTTTQGARKENLQRQTPAPSTPTVDMKML